MVRIEQDFVDPLEFMSQEDLDLLEDLADETKVKDMNNQKKLNAIIQFVLATGNNDDFVTIIKEMTENLNTIEYSDFTEITDKLDIVYWQDNYRNAGIGYSDSSLGNLFNGTSSVFDENNNSVFTDKARKLYEETRAAYDKQIGIGGVTKVSKVYSKPDFIEMSETSFPLKMKFELSPLATCKLFIMMKFYQSNEWGAYMKLDKALPKLEDLYKDEEWTIEVLDFVLIPQVRSITHIEYLENELPEYMGDWRQAKLDGFYVNAGRIHSHHSMTAFHSGTDTGEFEEAFKVEDRLFSIVTAFAKNKKIDINKDLDEFDYFFDCLDFDSVLFIPLIGDQKNQINCDYGYTIRQSLWLNKYSLEDIEKALDWKQKFEEMDVFVKHKYPLIEKLLRLQTLKKIDEVNFYNIRPMIFGNEDMFMFVQDMINLLGETKSEVNKNLEHKVKLDKIKKLLE